MPAMTESETMAVSYTSSDDPRRLVLADLVGQLAVRLAAQARAYERVATSDAGPLRPALEGLARAKHAQIADLTPLGRALGAPEPPPPALSPLEPPFAWGVILGEAFQGERDLELVARELARLVPDPATRALGARLAAGAHQDAEEVRRLYLRYS